MENQEMLSELAAWAQDSAGADPLADDILEALAQLRAANERAERAEKELDFAGEIMGKICVYGTLVSGERPVDPPPHAAVGAILTQIARAERAEKELHELRRWKLDALEAMRESEEWRSKFNNEAVVMGYAGAHYLQSAYLIAVRCKAAEAKLAALPDAEGAD